jgi:hypothetical protein
MSVAHVGDMNSTTGDGRRRTLSLALALLAMSLPAAAQTGDVGCEPRVMRVTFYTCGEGSSRCLTRRGHNPIPFLTVAVGDRELLGQWLYVEDLGGWVYASDTGQGLRRGWLDVFVGEARMASHARRLGVQYWTVGVCAAPLQAPVAATVARAATSRDDDAPAR